MFNRLYYLLFVFILAGCFSVTIKTDGGNIPQNSPQKDLSNSIIIPKLIKSSTHKIDKGTLEITRLQHKVDSELLQINKLQNHKLYLLQHSEIKKN